jgi:hypothetical protein
VNTHSPKRQALLARDEIASFCLARPAGFGLHFAQWETQVVRGKAGDSYALALRGQIFGCRGIMLGNNHPQDQTAVVAPAF